MSTPREGYPRTAAVSPRVQVVESTDSTNADVVRLAAGDPQSWPHLSMLITEDQRRGRGRLDRVWTAPPGTALAVSVVVRVPGIPAAARGWVPLIAGAAMAESIARRLDPGAHDTALKWPNDVLVDGGKICGILAEAIAMDPDAIVIGAGVNTRMPRAELPVETATSFAAIGRESDDDALLADYVVGLERMLAALAAAGGDAEAAGVRAEVSDRCSTLGAQVRVTLPGGGVLEGRAEAIDGDGRLVVASTDGSTATVSAGDVVHVRRA
ncbi:BirA family biotin operon repressor/biotin-[acetyl-CoA-carboxylase] ligase [Microbacterium terrae]|uniref:biotin--[acetyl-CoA-carboxylase] ligase n=1 Tax=Microbacterium terrae TaxID=69369 RepID=UPI0005EC7D28|nr:biotin--[acetyl-CoA-carboxylase] ligase [Microbacterium terrae]MBP1077991.1 BirA family biotin operon repressor/biotin-[acetyl-CoA-carboxylase] ligase [Microbacterium terrae]GLK00160.1 biotin--[acetyl-CoA-carboxylase] ligase [Microbacterium terrae]